LPRKLNGDALAKTRISDLEAHLGYWLSFVSNHVSHAFRRKMAGRGVTVAEWVVLRELFKREPMAPSALAERLCMTRGAISKLVERLVRKSLVTRTADDEDRRYQAVALTARGQALVPELAALADRNDAEFFGALSASERKTLKRLMKQIVQKRDLKSVPID
jgi:DNA-binding MarR family transcriptional regulator